MEEIRTLYKETQERMRELEQRLLENDNPVIEGKKSELLSIQFKLQEILLANLITTGFKK